jgi:hypothetical protein
LRILRRGKADDQDCDEKLRHGYFHGRDPRSFALPAAMTK